MQIIVRAAISRLPYVATVFCIFFFLEHAGELRIIILVEEKRSHT